MAKKSKILIVIEEGPHFFYYKTFIKTLCERGHSVKVLFAKREEQILEEFKSELLDRFPNLSWGKSFYRPKLRWVILKHSRPILNYRRFLLEKNCPSFYAERLKKFLPFWLKPFVRLRYVNINFLIKTKLAKKLLQIIEDKTPLDKRIINQLGAINPNVILIVSGNNLMATSPDFDYVKAAKKMNIPHAFSIFSWDYLETKGVLHTVPDILFVWNNVHKNEAVNKLGFREENIRIIGATQFDERFKHKDARLSENRKDFCRLHRLDPERPIITYLGSAGIFGNEAWFLEKIYKALKESKDEKLNKVQIIVRPHPKNNRSFKNCELKDVVLIPRLGRLPSSKESMQLFYDTLYHSIAAIGIGTSGFIDAIVDDKPGVTLLTDHYDHIQANAPHFKHLLKDEVLKTTDKISELPNIILDLLNGYDECKERRASFVKKFIRPRGLKIPASEIMVQELESLISPETENITK